MLLLANFYGGTLGREIRIVNNYEAPSSVAISLAMDLIGHVSRVVNLQVCFVIICNASFCPSSLITGTSVRRFDGYCIGKLRHPFFITLHAHIHAFLLC